MKKSQIIFNVLMVLAVGILYFLHFNVKKSTVEVPSVKTSRDSVILAAEPKPTSTQPGVILYVNIDTINQKFSYIKRQKAALEKQQAQAEATLKSKGAALESQIMAYQKKAQAGELTAQEAQVAEQKLGQQQQAIMAQQEKLSSDLITKTGKMQEELNSLVKKELKVFLKQYNADYILGYAENGNILLTNTKLDITKEVLAKLNNSQSK